MSFPLQMLSEGGSHGGPHQRRWIGPRATRTYRPIGAQKPCGGGRIYARGYAGILLSYGPDVLEICRRGTVYVDRILKCERPGELPVEQPTKFQFVINLKTADALGINIPALKIGDASVRAALEKLIGQRSGRNRL